MEKCHTPFKIRRVDYICDWLEHVLSEYLVGTEAEWERRIYSNWCVNVSTAAGLAQEPVVDCQPLQPPTVRGPRSIPTQAL